MKTLTIRPPSQHAGGAILLTLGLAAVAVLATRSHLAGGDTRKTLAIVGVGAEAGALMTGWAAVVYRFAFTECSPAGIRGRGFGLEWQYRWHEVRDISVRYSRFGPTRTLALTTVSGRKHMLVTGAVTEAESGSTLQQIRDYWHRAAGSHAGLDVARVRDRVRRLAGTIIQAVPVILVLAAAALPLTLAEGGPALLARLGQGEHGSFTGYDYRCPSACYWTGVFTPDNGYGVRDGMTLAAGPGLSRPGGQVPAVYPGSAAMVYRVGSGAPFVNLVAVVVSCLAVEVLRAGWSRLRRRPVRAHPARRHPDASAGAMGDGAAAAGGGRAGTGARLLLTGTAVMLIIGGSWFAVALHPPTPAPSRLALACADYKEWLANASIGGGQSRLALLARAVREAPWGTVGQNLTGLFSDEKAAALAQGTGQAASPLDDGSSPALADASSNIALVSRDCA